MIIYTKQKASRTRKPKQKILEQNRVWLAEVNKIQGFGSKPSSSKKEFKYELKTPPGREKVKYNSVEDRTTGALTKSGIMKDYHKMTPEDRKIVEDVGQCVAPLHKGNLVYVTPGLNPAGLGRKNEVL